MTWLCCCYRYGFNLEGVDHHNTPVTVELGTATGVNRFDEYGLDWQGDQAVVCICVCVNVCVVCVHACVCVCGVHCLRALSGECVCVCVCVCIVCMH